MVFTLGVIAAQSMLAADEHPTGGSVRFPQTNAVGSDASGRYSYLRAEGLEDTLLGAPGALIALVEIPWDRWNQTGSARFHILGNDHRDMPLAGGLHLAAVADRERSVARALRFAASNGTDGVAMTLTLPGRPPRLLVAVRSDGASVELAAWADGVRIGTASLEAGSASFAGLRLAGDRLLVGCTGSGGAATAEPRAEATRVGFDGAIGFVGYHAAPVGDAALAEISAGRPPREALPDGAAWILARELDEPGLPAFAAPIWATGDAHPEWTVEGGGPGLRAGSDLAASRSGDARFGLAPIRDGQVWGARPGQTRAPVAVGGISAGLTGGVEIRAIYADGTVHTDWTALPAVELGGGGAWSGAIELDLFAGGWGHIEARPAAMPALVQRSRADCGVGWVIAPVGQSNAESVWKGSAGDPAAVTGGPIGNLSFCMPFRSRNTASGLAAGSGSVVMDVVTLDRPRSEGLIAAAEEVRRYGDTPVMIFDMTQEGSSVAELQNDGTDRRLWSDSPGDQFAVAGNAVSAFVIQWALQMGGVGSSPAGIDTAGVLDALLDGQDSVTAGWTKDHWLLSSEFAHGANTGVALMQRTGGGSATEPPRDHDGFWERIAENPVREMDFYPQKIRAYAAAKGYAEGQDIRDTERLGGHFETSQGKRRSARRLLASGLRACGVDTTANPRFTGISANAGRDVLTATFSRPNGGALRTGWSFAGETPPAGVNPVQGFEVHDPAGTAGLPGDVTRSGFAAAIADGSAGAVALTKDSGAWSEGTMVAFAPGAGLGYNSAVFADQLYKGWLYESSSQEGGLGVPVMGMDAWHIPVDAPATLGALLVVDPSDLAGMFQETTGAGASMPAAVDQPVGTIVNRGALGGYLTAPSLAERPILRRIANGDDANVRAGAAFGDRPLWFLEFADTDKELVFSGGPAIPDSPEFAVGLALRQLDPTATRRMVFTQAQVGGTTGTTFMLTQNVNVFGQPVANRFGVKWPGSTGVRNNWPVDFLIGDGRDKRVIFNTAAGAGASSMLVDRLTEEATFTAAGGTEQSDAFRIGSSPDPFWASGRFRLYGLFVAPRLDTPLKRRQASVWLAGRHGALYPHW